MPLCSICLHASLRTPKLLHVLSCPGATADIEELRAKVAKVDKLEQQYQEQQQQQRRLELLVLQHSQTTQTEQQLGAVRLPWLF